MPHWSDPICGSARSTTSPFISNTDRETPWAAGCWGPKFEVKFLICPFLVVMGKKEEIRKILFPKSLSSTTCTRNASPCVRETYMPKFQVSFFLQVFYFSLFLGLLLELERPVVESYSPIWSEKASQIGSLLPSVGVNLSRTIVCNALKVRPAVSSRFGNRKSKTFQSSFHSHSKERSKAMLIKRQTLEKERSWSV